MKKKKNLEIFSDGSLSIVFGNFNRKKKLKFFTTDYKNFKNNSVRANKKLKPFFLTNDKN